MDTITLRRVIQTVADTIIEQADQLTLLDQAIGDGDHGINMKRGCEAVLEELDGITEKPLPEALKAIGMKLVMTVGGASGPLYGTLIMAFGKALPADREPQENDYVVAFEAAVDAVKARGKSEAGQKTMLDVLIPAQQGLTNIGDDWMQALPRIAAEAADATVPMQATRGRASFLGERSIGHMDPGACSTALMVSTVCRSLGERS